MTFPKRAKWLLAAGLFAFAAAAACTIAQNNQVAEKLGHVGRAVTLAMPDRVPGDAVLFFWYGCPHCRAVEGVIARQDGEAQFDKVLNQKGALHLVPVPINPVWELHARLFYALSHQGVTTDTHRLMMAVIQDNRLDTKEGMKTAIRYALDAQEKSGLPIKATLDEIFVDMDSAKTTEEIEQAKALAAQVGLQGVPSLLLNKETLLELGKGVTYETLLPTALNILTVDDKHE